MADLAFHVYTSRFYLDVSETAHTTNGVLFQKKRGRYTAERLKAVYAVVR